MANPAVEYRRAVEERVDFLETTLKRFRSLAERYARDAARFDELHAANRRELAA